LHAAYEIASEDENGDPIVIPVDESMREVRVADMEQPWSWEAIDAEIASRPGMS
jgi:hypothetical protein